MNHSNNNTPQSRCVSIDAAEKKRRLAREHAELVESVWAMKTIHGMTLQSIAREYGLRYRTAEDLLIEGAQIQIRRTKEITWNRARLTFGGRGPTPPMMAMKVAA